MSFVSTNSSLNHSDLPVRGLPKNNKHIFIGVLVNINIVHLLTVPQAYQHKIN